MAAFNALHSSLTPRSLAILPHTSPRRHLADSPVKMLQPEPDSMFDQMQDPFSSDKENIHPNIVLRTDQGESTSSDPKAFLDPSPSKIQMSFTPRRTKPPPRAWERRPATPFVQRSEGQKIWKRLPLAELGAEAREQTSRREREELQNYTRVIKKLRLDADVSHEDTHEENDAATTTETVFCGTKWEQEHIEKGGSPKKKMRSEKPNTSPLCSQINIECDPASDSGETESVESEQQDSDTKEDPAEVTAPAMKKYEATSSNDSQPAIAVVTEPQLLITEVSVAQEEIEPKSVEYNQNGAEKIPAEEWLSTESGGSDVVLLANNMVQTCLRESTESFATSRGEDEEEGEEGKEERFSASEEQTALPLVVGVSNDGQPIASLFASDPTRAQSVSLAPENDEAAFLRDFLERAQATRAARIAVSPQKTPAPPSPFVDEIQSEYTMAHHDESEAADDVEDDDLSPPAEFGQNISAPQEENPKSSSPLRRSTRTSNRSSGTRLPRFHPQSLPLVPHFGPVLPSQHATVQLPNTIQLKRATGCEFIFNAREQQTLAVMTRTNTKKNQGAAVHVMQRLAQLRKEFEVLYEDDQSSEERVNPHDSPVNVEKESVALSDVNQGQKKRKRERQDDGKAVKVRKTVKWPVEEQLVRFREASPVADHADTAQLNDCTQDTPSPIESGQLPIMQEFAISEEDQTVTNEVNKEYQDKSHTEDMSKLKVRRIRKIKLDSVNGTPAPKTRSRSIIDHEPAENSAGSVATRQTSSAIPGTRRSSRMPVPVNKPILQPSFTTASIQPRAKITDEQTTKSLSKTVNKKFVGEPTMNAVAKSEARDSHEPKRKLDGGRRLRAKRG